MKKRLIYKIVFPILFIGMTLSISSSDDNKSLYEERKKLNDDYFTIVGNDYIKNKSKADEINRLLEINNQQYLAVLSEIKSGEINNTCANYKNDKIVAYLCNFYLLEKNNNIQFFIDNTNVEKEYLNAFWEIERIGSETRSFVDDYIIVLFSHAKSNNIRALMVLLQMMDEADGYFAENIYDKVEKIFIEKPDFIINEWEKLRTIRKSVNKVFKSEYYIIPSEKYIEVCKQKGKDCHDLLRLLEENK